MAASKTATPGAAFPPARGSRSGAPRVPMADGRQDGRIPGSGGWAADLVDVTYRQIDYWSRQGFFGQRNANPGNGGRRRFDDVDLEIASALKGLAALGATAQWLELAADAVRSERVRPGDWLLVTIAGHTLRCSPHDLPRIVTHGDDHAAWLVPLTAFDEGRAR